jgi:hypothetical protein
MTVQLPPELGQRMRLNLVRVDVPAGKRLAAASWNCITYADFHALERMLTVVFTGTRAPAPAPGEGPAVDAGAAGAEGAGSAGAAKGAEGAGSAGSGT